MSKQVLVLKTPQVGPSERPLIILWSHPRPDGNRVRARLTGPRGRELLVGDFYDKSEARLRILVAQDDQRIDHQLDIVGWLLVDAAGQEVQE